MMYLFRAVQFISESPHFYTWNLKGSREPIGDKLEDGVVPVPVGSIYYMEIKMIKLEPCPT